MDKYPNCSPYSPLVTLNGAWETKGIEANATTLPDIHVTSLQAGDTASFSFVGTGIWIYAGTNSSHGEYSVLLDDNLAHFNASDSVNSLTPLYVKLGLSYEEHNITITNVGSTKTGGTSLLDIGKFIWAEWEWDATIQTHGDTFSSPKFGWYPTGQWESETLPMLQNTSLGAIFMNVTLETTNVPNAWMQYNFSANAISVYGLIGPDQGAYSVELQYDNGEIIDLPGKQEFNASFPVLYGGGMLFHTSNLDAQRNTTLTMRAKESKALSIFGVSMTTEVTSTSDGISDHGHAKLSAGAIAGIVIASLGGVAVLAFLCVFLYRQYRSKDIRQRKTNNFIRVFLRRWGNTPAGSETVKEGMPILTAQIEPLPMSKE